jgi:hypothetical protein
MMADISHFPNNKISAVYMVIVYSLASFNIDMQVLGFFGDVIIWGSRIFVIVSGGIFAYNSIMSERRFKLWAKNGFKKEDKDKYRIK